MDGHVEAVIGILATSKKSALVRPTQQQCVAALERSVNVRRSQFPGRDIFNKLCENDKIPFHVIM
jgi:hypothetical protein